MAPWKGTSLYSDDELNKTQVHNRNNHLTSCTYLSNIKYFFCKKSIGNAEFIIFVGCVYIRQNSFQLRLESWLLLKRFIKIILGLQRYVYSFYT